MCRGCVVVKGGALLAPDDVPGLEEMAARVRKGLVVSCGRVIGCVVWCVWGGKELVSCGGVVVWLQKEGPNRLLIRCQ